MLLFTTALSVAQKFLSYNFSSRLAQRLQILKHFPNKNENLLSEMHMDQHFFHRSLPIHEIELYLWNKNQRFARVEAIT